MSSVAMFKGAKEAPRAMRSRSDTLCLTLAEINNWRIPSFQRPVRVNDKVRALAETLKNEGVLTGVLTLGTLKSDPTIYVVDGQHRLEAFRISETRECYADVRIVNFDSMADMADEFVNLQTSLVRMRPDDVLRGLEASTPTMRLIRDRCSFVGYDQIRRGGPSSSLLSMSVALRCWSGSTHESPTNGGNSAHHIAKEMPELDAEQMVRFLNMARTAWGTDPQNFRLWGALNLTMCMWLWRRLVLDDGQDKTKRHVHITGEKFKQCLMAVSANADYVDWLVGRNMNDRDRAPCYARLKTIVQRRLSDDGSAKVKLPQPAWASR